MISERLLAIVRNAEDAKEVVSAAKLLIEVDAMEEKLRRAEVEREEDRADAAANKAKLASLFVRLAQAGQLPPALVNLMAGVDPAVALDVPAAQVLRVGDPELELPQRWLEPDDGADGEPDEGAPE